MATATKTGRKQANKITRVIIPALYEAPKSGLPIKEIVDPLTGKPVEALYFYEALKQGVIVQTNEDVRTGGRGRPAKNWKLSKATRDRVRKQRNRAADKAPQAEPALV